MKATREFRLLSVVLTAAVAAMNLGPAPRQVSASGATRPALLAPAAPQTATVTRPAALDAPLAMTREQSAYRGADVVANTLMVTLTVSNLRPPANPPSAPTGATVTDTIAFFAGFDPTQDANTLRGILVSDVLTPGVTLLGASHPVNVSGPALQISLGDLAPLSSLTVTLRLAVPGTSPDFMSLDDGAIVYATLQGRMATASPGPIVFAPDALGPFLVWTPDADTRDAWMLRALGGLGGSPTAMFEAVRGFGYESYLGSLRGTRGTLWSKAGNALDKSSLLIAMLRASGVPARYRHGTLDAARTSELIGSMFPPLPDTRGFVPPGAQVFTPISNTQLISETRDHWWVEAYLPGSGWTNLDPSFASAAVGQTFHTALATDGSDQIAEVPDALRHKVDFRLIVERYGPFSFSAAGLPTIMPLEASLNTVQLVGNPVSLEHFVDTDFQAGLVFGTVVNTYIPYLVVGDQAIDGTPFQDIISSFPFGYQLSTAEWLAFDLRHPNGASETYTRTIADLIGVAARAGGGTITNSFGASTALVDGGNVYSFLFAPSSVPREAVDGRYPALARAAAQAQSLMTIADTLTGTSLTEIAALQNANAVIRAGVREAAGAQALSFAAASDFGTPSLARGTHVKAYFDMPRVIIASQQKEKDAPVATAVLDLARNRIRAVPYPGQTIEGGMVFNLSWGLLQGDLEHELLKRWHGAEPRGVSAVFARARAEGVDIALLTTRNLSVLGRLPLSSEAKTRIAQTLDGRPDVMVMVPTRMITLTGQSTVGWYALNMLDGRVSDMMENGLHTAAIEYAFLLTSNLQNFGFAIAGFFHGWFAETMFFLGYFLEQTPLSEGELKSAYSSALSQATASAENLAAMISAGSAASGGGASQWIDCYIDGCGFEIGFSWKIPLIESPLPDGFGDTAEGWATLGGIELPEDPEAGPCSVSLLELSADCGDKLTFEWHSPFGFNNGVAAAEAFIGSHNDPPVPYGWVGEARFTPMTDTLATRVVTAPATHAGTTITGALVVPNARLIQSERASFYAPAAAGLGIGGAHPGFSPFAPGGAVTLSNARLNFGPSGAPLYVNGVAVGAANGVALPAFSGSLAITESGAALDSAALNGTGTFFALSLSPASSAIAPGASAAFSTGILANAAGVYTLMAEVPSGWAAVIAPDGAITASSPAGAAAGDYVVLVVAQSSQTPDVFASAVHTVTISALDAVAVSVGPDPLHTVAWGEPGPGEFRTNPNNGQMQLSGAAWTVAITNSSNAAHAFAINVTGLPASWGLLSASVITLSAGAVGQVGLAISPTAPLIGGANYPFTVNVDATDMALSASDGDTFVVPASPYAWLNAPAHALFAAPGGTTVVSLTLKNVGNAPGAFPLSMTIPAGWAHDAPTGLSVAAGDTRAQTVTVTTTGTLFSQYVVRAGTRSLGYDQSAYAVVILVTPYAACVFNGGADLAALGDAAVTTALSNLGTATLALEQDPTSVAARTGVVAAINTLVAGLAPYPAVPALASLAALAEAMPGHSSEAQIDADLATLCGIIGDLGAQTGAAVAHAFSLSFSPGADAALPGRAVSLTFTLANRGTSATTFGVTITSPALASPITLAPTLAPGASASQTVVVSSAIAAFVPVYAAVTAATGVPALPTLSDSAIAGVSFISPLLQVFDVTATPGFVDFGASATSLSARIANVGNWRMQALAMLTVIGPGGGTSATLSAPVTLAAGNPTAVNFGSLNTSGFQTGTYTLTVSAMVTAPAGLAGFASTDYGFFSVGQALYATGRVAQPVVAPGNVTATVLITTFVNPDGSAELLRMDGKPRVAVRALQPADSQPEGAEPVVGGEANPAEDAGQDNVETNVVPADLAPESKELDREADRTDWPAFSSSIVRTETASPLATRTGTWTTVSGSNLASGASYSRSSVVSSTLAFTFTGSWVSLGYLAGTDGRQFEIYLDGVSLGIVDSYANESDLPQSRLFAGLVTATHVISVFVLSTKNAFASTTAYAKIDFFDTWDGAPLSDGVFEHSSPRLILGSGWTTQTLAGASGGSYGRSPSGSGVAWFAFTGDSVAYQLVRDFSAANQASLFVDGMWKADIDMATVFANATVTTATISFDGLGAGAHVLSLVHRRGSFFSLDTFATPGVAPFHSTPILTGVARYEENHPALRYNGLPFTATKTSWAESGQANASSGWYAASSVASDTVGLTFTGTWVSLGYVANTNAGRIEVFIDGATQGVIDTYGNAAAPRSAVFSGLSAGAHTLTATVLGTRNAFANAPGNFNLDYIDVWDGATLPDGRFEEDSPRVWYGTGWDRSAVAGASGGWHATSQASIGAAWFAFSGDSVSYHLLRDFNSAGMASVFVDGQWKADIDFYTVFANAAVLTYTLSLDGLGAGPHVLTVDNRRGTYISLDAVSTPGDAPFYVAPIVTGVIRYEENHPALRYNGAPLTATKTSWSENAQANASAGWYAASSVASDTLSLAFTGTWASLGYVANTNAGLVEVFIDGASQGVIDTYGRSAWPRSRVFGGLAAGAHVLTVTVLGARNAFASAPGSFYFDYLDVWDGATLPDGRFEEDSPRVRFGTGWDRSAIANASGGAHATSPNTIGAAWFAFSGDSVAWEFLNGFTNAGRAGIQIDGVDFGVFDLGAPFTGTSNFTRALSFGGLGAGPHVAMIWLTRGSYVSLDAFSTPGVAPFYAPPARTGIVRYEEDDPALRYNGAVYSVTKQTWAETTYGMASDGYVRYSATASDTLSLAFSGTWASLGYGARANGGRAEIFIDGVSQGVIDTYGRDDDARSVVFGGLSAGAHVISLTVLGTRNAFAGSPGNVHFDHLDVWDGSALVDGAMDESSPRVRYSDGWLRAASTSAEGGFYAGSPNATGAAWVSFAGDSVRLTTLAGLGNAGELGVSIDGRWKGWLDLDAPAVTSRTAAFGGLGAGPHVMALVSHRGSYFNLDSVVTPADGPFFDAEPNGVFRLEEDNPAIRLNGAPYTQTKSSWDYLFRAQASDRYVAFSSAPSDTFSLNFDGAWVSLGFATRTDGRQAEIFLDGVSQGVVDTYSASDDVLARVYGGLVSATHVISFNVLSTVNVSATGSTKYLQLDYVDVWDGTSEPKGVFQHDPAEQYGGRVYRSDDWTVSAKTNTLSGTFLEDGTNAWFLFSGVSVTVIGVTDVLSPSKAEIFIDGVSQGVLDLHYPFARSSVATTIGGLGAGAHVLRLVDRSGAGSNLGAGLDAFLTGDATFAGMPMVEWSANGSASNEVFAITPAVGDLDGDGIPEIIATTTGESCIFGSCTFTNKALYVFEGDSGALVFSRTITGTHGCSGFRICGGVGSPAIADIDGGGDIEIIVDSSSGLRAYKNDGTLLWWNQSIQGTWASAVAIANLDDDDAPEIATVHDSISPNVRRVHIAQPDGTSSWTYTLPTTLPGPRTPVLADLNGDTRMDLVIASGQTIYEFLSNGVSMTLAYTRNSGLDHYGSPAVADIDADGLPEIIIGWEGIVQAYEHDLTPKWVYTTGGVFPSTVSIAELDGNDGGAPEIVLYSKTSAAGEEGRVFALNHDGTLLWSRAARDTTISSAGVAVLDLDGDGAWEVVWNGSVSGTLIFKGATGEIQFNDDVIRSGTLNETPVIADVDADGRAELVLVSGNALVVLGFDAVWASSRPVWNQHSYHITNINDDLSVPVREPDSWAYHNTYRTQSPLTAPAPVYYIEISHTLAPSVTVVPGSFSRVYTDANPLYTWGYKHYWYEPGRVTRFDIALPGMQPGEMRRVSEGTVVSYTVGAGRNTVRIPPLYVAAAHILNLSPQGLSIQRGATARLDVALSNPGTTPDVYTLTVAGLPSSLTAALPETVSLAAGATVTVGLELAALPDADLTEWEILVNAANTQGGHEAAPATVTVVDALRVQVGPDSQIVETGAQAAYTVVITNLEAVARTYSVTLTGLGANPVSLPATLTLGAGSAGSVPVSITAMSNESSLVFAARVTNTATNLSAFDTAVLNIVGAREVTAAFIPTTATAGLGNDGYLTLTLENIGSIGDTYDITLTGRPDWWIVSERSASEIDEQYLPAAILNKQTIRVRVNAGFADGPGTYTVTALVRSRSNPAVTALAYAWVTLVDEAVYADFDPFSQQAAAGTVVPWALVVTNYGNVASTFYITGAGELGGLMQFGAPSVTLGPGSEIQIPVTLTIPPWALPGWHDIQAWVWSASEPAVGVLAVAGLEITSTAGMTASLSPPSIVVSDALPVDFALVISNTGEVSLDVTLSITSEAELTLSTPALLVPSRFGALALVSASAPRPGVYPITVTATSSAGTVTATATLIRMGRAFIPLARK